MKKIISLLGILSIGASSTAPITGNSTSNTKNKTYNNSFEKKSSFLGEKTKYNESCDQHNVSKYTVLELPVSTQRVMYIDEWVVNAHYD